jgi:malate dehydrogenase (oxaloacetate-decarboxylating)
LHSSRQDIASQSAQFRDKWHICRETNSDGRTGGIAEALQGADVCVAFSNSGPGIIRPEWISQMASDAIVFACANPVPEIWPWEALQAGARVVATGRSDFPNPVNNSLGFPGIFRGTLDVRARTITDEMAMAAAFELARAAEETRIAPDRILPSMDQWEVVPRLAAAVAVKAQQQGIAQLSRTADQVLQEARRVIGQARRTTALLLQEGMIPQVSRDEQNSVSATTPQQS